MTPQERLFDDIPSPEKILLGKTQRFVYQSHNLKIFPSFCMTWAEPRNLVGGTKEFPPRRLRPGPINGTHERAEGRKLLCWNRKRRNVATGGAAASSQAVSLRNQSADLSDV